MAKETKADAAVELALFGFSAGQSPVQTLRAKVGGKPNGGNNGGQGGGGDPTPGGQVGSVTP